MGWGLSRLEVGDGELVGWRWVRWGLSELEVGDGDLSLLHNKDISYCT